MWSRTTLRSESKQHCLPFENTIASPTHTKTSNSSQMWNLQPAVQCIVVKVREIDICRSSRRLEQNWDRHSYYRQLNKFSIQSRSLRDVPELQMVPFRLFVHAIFRDRRVPVDAGGSSSCWRSLCVNGHQYCSRKSLSAVIPPFSHNSVALRHSLPSDPRFSSPFLSFVYAFSVQLLLKMQLHVLHDVTHINLWQHRRRLLIWQCSQPRKVSTQLFRLLHAVLESLQHCQFLANSSAPHSSSSSSSSSCGLAKHVSPWITHLPVAFSVRLSWHCVPPRRILCSWCGKT